MMDVDEIFYVATGKEDVDELGNTVNDTTQMWLDGSIYTDYYLDFLVQEWEDQAVVLAEYETALKAMIDKYGKSL